MRNWQPPRALFLSWLALLCLLGVTVLAAYQPLGVFNTAIALGIAMAKALFIAVLFMELRQAAGLTVAFACAGFFWLGIMLWLTLADYTTRRDFI